MPKSFPWVLALTFPGCAIAPETPATLDPYILATHAKGDQILTLSLQRQLEALQQ